MELLLAGLGTETPPEAQEGRLARLTARAAAHRQAQAALAADPQQIPDAALRLRELSALRYGVDPVLSAAAIRVSAQRYPADLPQPRKLPRPAPAARVTSANTAHAPTTSQAPTGDTPPPEDAAAPGAGMLVPAADWLAPQRRIKLD